MLLIERIFARFTSWLCDLFELTQVDVDRFKERELGIKPVPHYVEDGSADKQSQVVRRFPK